MRVGDIVEQPRVWVATAVCYRSPEVGISVRYLDEL